MRGRARGGGLMASRRQFLTTGAVSLAGLAAGVRFLEGQTHEPMPDGSAARGMITPAAQQAIDQGLAYLARVQHRDHSFGINQYRGNVAVTSLCGLAFMAAGHMPGRGKYGKAVAGALEYVLNQEESKSHARGRRGFLHNANATPHGPMYGHGFGTLFLAELYGMVHDTKLKNDLKGTLERAFQLIVQSQNSEGGWRYHPESRDADLSVTICQIMRS